jgi:hypothetical protein
LHAAKQGDSQEKPARVEWQILRDLKRTLGKKELSIEEKTRVANANACQQQELRQNVRSFVFRYLFWIRRTLS